MSDLFAKTNGKDSEFSCRTAAWSSTNSIKVGKELVWLDRGGARGSLIYYDDQFADLQRPFQLSYRYLWDDEFSLTQAVIEVSFAGCDRFLQLERRGAWQTSDGDVLAPGHCIDLDLWPSPLTNTLALRRMKLAVGERREVGVLCVEAPFLKLRPEMQIYMRLSADRFYFESPANNFSSVITVDSDYLVVDYPHLFRREC